MQGRTNFGLLVLLFTDLFYSISNCSESLKAQGGTGAYFNDYLNWDKIGEFKDYIFNSPAKEVAAQLLDTKVTIVVIVKTEDTAVYSSYSTEGLTNI